MEISAGFNVWYGLIGLIPLIVYIILIFTYHEVVPITALCVVLGAVITHQTMFSFADILVKSLGSFMAMIGLIIMMGRGLGEVLLATKVSHTIVQKIIFGIGAKTENRAKLGIMLASLTIVGLLGTMAGGNAIIAPIVLPVAAAAGLTKSTVGVLLHACGEEGLILGPFTPPVLTLIGLTHLSYGEMLIKCAIPVSLITLGVTWIMTNKIQKWTKGVTDYEQQMDVQQFIPNARQIRTTLIFIACFVGMLLIGMYYKSNTSYVVLVMISLALITGLVGGLSIKSIFDLFIKGMGANVSFFLLFLLFTPFLEFMEQSGAFKAIVVLMKPLVDYGGSVMVPITAGLLGTFGLHGATVAVMKIINDMFLPLVQQYGVSMVSWTIAILVATRACDFITPGGNMFGAMGFAESKDIASMIKNGWPVAFAQILFLCVFSYIAV